MPREIPTPGCCSRRPHRRVVVQREAVDHFLGGQLAVVRVPDIEVIDPERPVGRAVCELQERPETGRDLLAQEQAELVRELNVAVLRPRLGRLDSGAGCHDHRGDRWNQVDLERPLRRISSFDHLQAGERVSVEFEASTKGRELRERSMTHVAGEASLPGEARDDLAVDGMDVHGESLRRAGVVPRQRRRPAKPDYDDKRLQDSGRHRSSKCIRCNLLLAVTRLA